MFRSDATFCSSSFMAHFVSSSTTGGTTRLFSFGSTISPSLSPSAGFSFGASSNSAASSNTAHLLFGSSNTTSPAPSFSFVASTASSASRSMFGNTFSFGTAGINNNNSNNNNSDQTNMEYSMAEDTMKESRMPSCTVFGQPQVQPLASGFVFGSAAPSTPNPYPFRFGTQQQNHPFQASSSLDVNAGGSFAWGSGGSNRKFVRVKQRQRKK